MLSHHNCISCNYSFLTFAKKPYCTTCIQTECCMSNLQCCDGRNSCNSTFDMVTHNGKKYCLGHYKLLQNKCNICSKPRPETCTDFQQDHMWYCTEHKKIYRQNLIKSIYDILKTPLYIDVIVPILKNVILPTEFRYPDGFNIPIRKSLKQ